MPNRNHQLRVAIRAQRAAQAAEVAADAAVESRSQDTLDYVAKKWPVIERILKDALEDANDVFKAENSKMYFSYVPLPQAGGDFARAIIRLHDSIGLTRSETNLRVLTTGTIVLDTPADEFGLNYTRTQWGDLLTRIFVESAPRN